MATIYDRVQSDFIITCIINQGPGIRMDDLVCIRFQRFDSFRSNLCTSLLRAIPATHRKDTADQYPNYYRVSHNSLNQYMTKRTMSV